MWGRVRHNRGTGVLTHIIKGLFAARELNWTGVRELQCEQPHCWMHVFRTRRAPTVLVSLQSIPSWRWRAWPINGVVTGSTRYRSVQFISGAVKKNLYFFSLSLSAVRRCHSENVVADSDARNCPEGLSKVILEQAASQGRILMWRRPVGNIVDRRRNIGRNSPSFDRTGVSHIHIRLLKNCPFSVGIWTNARFFASTWVYSSQTASRSVQPTLQGSRSQTDHTERQDICSNRPHLHYAVQPKIAV